MAGLSGKKLPKARRKRWVGKILPGFDGQQGDKRSTQAASTARAAPLPKPEEPRSAPSLLNRSYRVTAEIEVPQGLANSVRLTMVLGESTITPASLRALQEEMMRRQIRRD
jgi:hypothetical protein